MEDKAYTDLMISLTERIFKKNYNYMLDAKDDMIGDAFLNLWSAKDKYDSNNIYRHQDKYIHIEQESEEGYTLGLEDIIGAVDVNYNDVEFKELMEKFDRNIGERNKHTSRKINIDELHFIINKLYEGYNKCEISKMLCVSSTNVNKKVNRIRDIITEIKNNE